MSADWPFDDPEDRAVFSFRRIVREGSPVLLVTHDEGEGGWQFLDGGDVATQEEAALVGLGEITRIDPSLLQLSDLPPGWIAWRDGPGEPWKRAPADDEAERKVASDVEAFGWHVLLVPEDDEGPPFGYTIGLFKTFGHPEVAVFGLLDPETLHSLLNILGESVRQGRRYADGASGSGIIEGFDVRFREVPRAAYAEHFGYASRFYEGRDYPVLQCLWPDAAGHYPVEAAFDESLRRLQPLLGEPGQG
jgi:hypothetical protein